MLCLSYECTQWVYFLSKEIIKDLFMNEYRKRFLTALAASLGGLLFGYNTAVISGALLCIAPDFNLTTFQQELVVSTILIGALFGSLFCGVLADRLGRKKALLCMLLLFFIGGIMIVGANKLEILLLGRFVTGLGVGIASVGVPLYIAEIAPLQQRGLFVSLNQLMITIGAFLSFLTCYLWLEQNSWRPLFAFPFLPMAVQFVALFFIPESPVWLARHKANEAQSAPFTSQSKKLLIIGIGISVFQQITGINAIVYYAPKIFQAAGLSTMREALFATVVLGFVNIGVTLWALRLINRYDRRTLLFVGLGGMSLSLGLLSVSFSVEGGWVAVCALIVYTMFFAMSLGPLAWLIISEIFPAAIRGRAMGIAVCANWISNYFVSLTFLSLIQMFGAGPTFGLYFFICLLALAFVWKILPETKSQSLN